MTQGETTVALRLFGNVLSLKVTAAGKIDWHEGAFAAGTFSETFVYTWLLHRLKPLLFAMPLPHIHISVDEAFHAKAASVVQTLQSVLSKTNAAMQAVEPRPREPGRRGAVLLINVDGNARYRSLYERLVERSAVPVHYVDMKSGFNKETRRWEQAPPPFSIPELVERIRRDDVSTIVSTNHYFLEKYLFQEHVYLQALLDRLGVDYVIIDNDPYDGRPEGHLQKALFNDPGRPRFSLDPVAHEPWDRAYGLENVRYVPIPQTYSTPPAVREGCVPRRVVVLSNSRIQMVQPALARILYFLDHLPSETLFRDASLWYLSVRRMITDILPLSEVERLHYNSAMWTFFYAATQFLKYEVIDSLPPGMPADIYGDPGWGVLFPELYRNRYLSDDEVDEVLGREDCIHLLLNYGLSYFDGAGAFFDNLRRGTLFVNYPPAVRADALGGLRHLEYENAEELRALIADYPNRILQPELLDSLRTLHAVCRDCSSAVEEQLVTGGATPALRARYDELVEEHRAKILDETSRYIDGNETMLRETFGCLFQGAPARYALERSRFYGKPYVRRLLAGART
ncbi:MAG: hypothetical protein HY900_38160 [Deltaproteobacteria bacterium]|nr:hypothetical protein [Deltaproteobacteria bacterium]